MADTYEETREETQETRASLTGQDALRENGMMLHLLDSLASGEDIGHYGRLVFAMVARHFVDEEELRELLLQDPSFDEAQALALIEQVQGLNMEDVRKQVAEQQNS